MLAKSSVAGDTSGDHHGTGRVVATGLEQRLSKDPDGGVLETGGQVENGPGYGLFALPIPDGQFPAEVFLGVAQYRGLDSGKAEIQLAVIDTRDGQLDCMGVSPPGQALDDGSTGIAEAQELGDLVEGFSGRIVPGPSQEPVAGLFLNPKTQAVYPIQAGVSSRDNQCQGGQEFFQVCRLRLPWFLPEGQGNGENMSFQVVHGYQRKIEAETQGLGVIDSHQERADQSGPLSYRYAVQIPRLDSGFPAGCLDDG